MFVAAMYTAAYFEDEDVSKVIEAGEPYTQFGSAVTPGSNEVMIRLFTVVIALYSPIASTQPAVPFEQAPKIDIHAHYFDDMPALAEMLKDINMRVVNVCLFKNRPEFLPVLHDRAVALKEQYAPQFEFASTFDLTGIGTEGYADGVTAWLDEYFAKGAVAVKIWKEVGMQWKLPDGSVLMPDSEHLDPIYAYLAERGKPLIAHFGDPVEAWQPLDDNNVHYKYFSENPEWHMHDREEYQSHAEITAAYDRVLAKHPTLVVIGAHLGSLEHDLDKLAERLDRFPNFYIDVAARTPDLHRYPTDTLRTFFITYQDRILYGLDQGRFTPDRTPSMEEQARYAQSVENAYRREYEFYAGEKLDLPQEVVEKFFSGNAIRLLGLESNGETSH